MEQQKTKPVTNSNKTIRKIEKKKIPTEDEKILNVLDTQASKSDESDALEKALPPLQDPQKKRGRPFTKNAKDSKINSFVNVESIPPIATLQDVIDSATLNEMNDLTEEGDEIKDEITVPETSGNNEFAVNFMKMAASVPLSDPDSISSDQFLVNFGTKS